MKMDTTRVVYHELDVPRASVNQGAKVRLR